MNPERNDVDISKLFKWGKVFFFQDGEGNDEVPIYMRLLGDADINKARVYALRKSAELRKDLSDTNSDMRWATIKQIDALTEEDLTNYILIFSMREIQNNAIKEVDIPFPKHPKGNAKLPALERFQKEVDEYPAKKAQAVGKVMQREVERLKNYLLTEPKEVLYKKYVNTLIDEFCEREALRAYADIEIYYGCFKDDEFTERFFDSFEAFDNLLTEQKVIIKEAYSTLSLDSDELKKLREVTL
jgi:hypothetical protein